MPAPPSSVIAVNELVRRFGAVTAVDHLG